jgi:formylglycine-generating enzyme required for sulfatase activity
MKVVSSSLLLAVLSVTAIDVQAAWSALRMACDGDDVGAEVSINGVFKGECPLDLQVSAGTVQLTVLKTLDTSHVRTFEQDIRMGDGVVTKVAVIEQGQLTAKGKGIEAERQRQAQEPGHDGTLRALVPEGEFLYGNDKQRLSLSAFYMDKFEVSTAQYAKFMAATGAKEPKYWPTSGLVSHDQKPVVGVSWSEADAYCRHYHKRLPTEQEWEKAMRGTDGRNYPWGNEEPTGRHVNSNKVTNDSNDHGGLIRAWFLEGGKSPYGILDRAGNVWEWTSSDYDRGQKVLRGGSWFYQAFYWGSTDRLAGTPDSRDRDFGFRCAQDVRN